MKSKKIFLIATVILFAMIFLSNVYAFRAPELPTTSDPNAAITDPVSKMWGTAAYIVQVIAIGCVVFAGVRYMFASADKRADLKKGLTYLAIGATIIFGAVTIIQMGASLL